MKVRMTLLNVPDEISPLKLRGYLRQEIKSVCSQYPDDQVMIKVTVTFRSLGMNGKKIDALFNMMVDTVPNLFRIEHVVMNAMPTMAEIDALLADMRADMAELSAHMEYGGEYPVQIFGFDQRPAADSEPNVDPICMVSSITSANHRDIAEYGAGFVIGTWFVSISRKDQGPHAHELHGPYANLDNALDEAMALCPNILFLLDAAGREVPLESPVLQ